MDMHVIGGMYSWSDDVTLMLMVPVIKITMQLQSYVGGAGTNSIGEFEGETSSISDVKFSAMIKLTEEDNDEGYRLGYRFEAQNWLTNQWAPWISGSIKLKAFSEGETWRIKSISIFSFSFSFSGHVDQFFLTAIFGLITRKYLLVQAAKNIANHPNPGIPTMKKVIG